MGFSDAKMLGPEIYPQIFTKSPAPSVLYFMTAPLPVNATDTATNLPSSYGTLSVGYATGPLAQEVPNPDL